MSLTLEDRKTLVKLEFEKADTIMSASMLDKFFLQLY